MILDHVIIDSLMQWARQQAPMQRNRLRAGQPVPRRRVVLDIVAEPPLEGVQSHDQHRVMCRVYLALEGNLDCSLEQLTTPLAETRIA